MTSGRTRPTSSPVAAASVMSSTSPPGSGARSQVITSSPCGVEVGDEVVADEAAPAGDQRPQRAGTWRGGVTWGDGRRRRSQLPFPTRYGHTRVGADAGVQRGREPGRARSRRSRRSSTGAARATRSSSSTTAAPTAPGGSCSGLRSPTVRYIRLRRNAGKSAGLSLGLEHVRGEYVVLMDADGQDDPEEVPRLLAPPRGRAPRPRDRPPGGPQRPLRQAHHVEALQRRDREGHRRAGQGLQQRPQGDDAASWPTPSRCTASCTATSRCWPCGTASASASSTSSTTSAATARSKFGRARFWRGFLDLVTVKFLTTYTARPFHLFGGIGFVIGLVGGVLLAWMGVSKLTRPRHRHPPGAASSACCWSWWPCRCCRSACWASSW